MSPGGKKVGGTCPPHPPPNYAHGRIVCRKKKRKSHAKLSQQFRLVFDESGIFLYGLVFGFFFMPATSGFGLVLALKYAKCPETLHKPHSVAQSVLLAYL